jgi:hypothetical protein
MASIINASSTGSGGIVQTADASGVLQLQSNGTVAVNILSGTSIAVGSATAYNGGGFGTNLSISGTSAAVTLYNGTQQYQIGANSANNLGFYSATNSTYMAQMNRYGIGVGDAVPSSGIGIKFPTTQSASSDATTLDDYERGNWTPIDASGAGLSLAVTSASYIKIGALVYVQFYLTYPSTASTDTATIGGLPFTAGAGYGMLYGRWEGTTLQARQFQVNAGDTSAILRGSGGSVNVTNANISGQYMLISGCYSVI